jgi:hypothetical protein
MEWLRVIGNEDSAECGNTAQNLQTASTELQAVLKRLRDIRVSLREAKVVRIDPAERMWRVFDDLGLKPQY